jgi:hypothetical protein
MASNTNNDDLLPEQTEGYKVGEKKTIDEYHKMGTFITLEATNSYHTWI